MCGCRIQRRSKQPDVPRLIPVGPDEAPTLCMTGNGRRAGLRVPGRQGLWRLQPVERRTFLRAVVADCVRILPKSRNRDRERRLHRQQPSSTSNSRLRVPKRLAVREVHLSAPDGGRFQSFQSLSVNCSTAKWESLLEFEAVEKCGRDLECADLSALCYRAEHKPYLLSG